MGGPKSGRFSQEKIDRMVIGDPGAEQIGLNPDTLNQKQVAAEEMDQSIAGLLELTSDATTWLYRIWPDIPLRPTKSPAYIDKFIGPVDIDDIKNKHGGGIFRTKTNVFKDGKAVNFLVRTFAIDGPPIYTGTPSGFPDGQSEGLSSRLDRLEKMIQAIGERAPKNQPLDLSQLKAIVEIMRPPENGSAKMIEVFTKGIEIARTVEAGGDNWPSVIKDLAPTLLEIIKPQRPVVIKRAGSTAQSPPDKAPAGQAAIPQLETSPTAEQDMSAQFIASLAETLAEALDNNDPPATVARIMKRYLTDEEYALINGLTPALIDEFINGYFPNKPEAKPLAESIIKLLKEA